MRDGGLQRGARRSQEMRRWICHTPVLAEFAAAMAEDLNVAGALGVMFSWLPEASPARIARVLRKMDRC